MAKPIISDPNGEKLTAAVNEAIEQGVAVLESHAIILEVPHKTLDDTYAEDLEEKLRKLGFKLRDYRKLRVGFIRIWMNY